MGTMSVYPTYFELNYVTIQPVSGQPWDIRFILAELNLYEDLFNATLSADLVIDDADNRINNFPITGFETVSFSFKTPAKDDITLTMRLYKISAKELERERRQVYVMHLVSIEEFTNAQVRVSKAYNNQLISDIADDIQTNYLNSEFNELETTKILHHIIPAFWSPFKTLNFLASRANSAQFSGANYTYFQTADGYNFQSIESLCSQNSQKQYILQPSNVRKQDIVDGYRPIRMHTDQLSMQSYKVENNFDTLENVSNGMYHNILLWHDITQGTFGTTEFDYPSSYNTYTHVEPNSVKNGLSYLWTSKSIDNGLYGAYKYFPVGQPESSNSVKTWLLQRISQLQQIQNVRMVCTIPGDSERRAGDIITIALPSPEPLINNQLVLDKYYQDRYLVTSVRHMINKEQYLTVLEVIKDSIFQAYP